MSKTALLDALERQSRRGPHNLDKTPALRELRLGKDGRTVRQMAARKKD